MGRRHDGKPSTTRAGLTHQVSASPDTFASAIFQPTGYRSSAQSDDFDTLGEYHAWGEEIAASSTASSSGTAHVSDVEVWEDAPAALWSDAQIHGDQHYPAPAQAGKQVPGAEALTIK